jgi:hypothetical protein
MSRALQICYTAFDAVFLKLPLTFDTGSKRRSTTGQASDP